MINKEDVWMALQGSMDRNTFDSALNGNVNDGEVFCSFGDNIYSLGD